MGIHAGMILGLDPGRDKVGWAFVGPEKELLLSGIFPARERELFWQSLRALSEDRNTLSTWTLERRRPVSGVASLDAVVVGKGTCGRELVADLKKQAFGCRVLCVDERGTTLEARGLYWRLHLPSWWQRFLPRSLWVPPRPLDDLAAWCIAMRGMDGKSEGSGLR